MTITVLFTLTRDTLHTTRLSFHSTVLTLDRMDFDAIFSTNKLKISMSNTSFHNFNFKPDGLRSEFSTNKLKYSSYLSTSAVKSLLHTKDVIQEEFRLCGS